MPIVEVLLYVLSSVPYHYVILEHAKEGNIIVRCEDGVRCRVSTSTWSLFLKGESLIWWYLLSKRKICRKLTTLVRQRFFFKYKTVHSLQQKKADRED